MWKPKEKPNFQVTEVPADEGDVTIFAANRAAVQGQDFKHGVTGQHVANGIRISQWPLANRFFDGQKDNEQKSFSHEPKLI